MGKPTIQTVLQAYKDEIDDLSLPLFQIKALEKLSVCRTAKLGGHAQYCENGHLDGVWYNSCKHRSCPQCQSMAKAEWLENVQRLLLNCPHQHVIFTVPHELNSLWRHNRGLMANLLFQSVQKTLHQFAKDPKYLGATPGILSALHTWGRPLVLHTHVHALVSLGGIDSGGSWVDPKKKHLFPQKPVMQVFRGKLRAAIRSALDEDELVLPKDLSAQQLKNLLNKLGRKEWVVHFCNHYVHGKGVAKYLARYVKGGPFNNSQIKRVEHGRVKFLYKSHKTGGYEWLDLSVGQFVHRVAEHVLPSRKCGFRYSGLYSSSSRKKLNVAREALGQDLVKDKIQFNWSEFLEGLGHKRVCSQCLGAIVKREDIGRELTL